MHTATRTLRQGVQSGRERLSGLKGLHQTPAWATGIASSGRDYMHERIVGGAVHRINAQKHLLIHGTSTITVRALQLAADKAEHMSVDGHQLDTTSTLPQLQPQQWCHRPRCPMQHGPCSSSSTAPMPSKATAPQLQACPAAAMRLQAGLCRFQSAAWQAALQ